jgi:hypothetical protein
MKGIVAGDGSRLKIDAWPKSEVGEINPIVR